MIADHPKGLAHALVACHPPSVPGPHPRRLRGDGEGGGGGMGRTWRARRLEGADGGLGRRRLRRARPQGPEAAGGRAGRRRDLQRAGRQDGEPRQHGILRRRGGPFRVPGPQRLQLRRQVPGALRGPDLRQLGRGEADGGRLRRHLSPRGTPAQISSYRRGLSPDRQRLPAPRRVAGARRDLPRPPLRRRGEEGRQCAVREGRPQRQGRPGGRGHAEPHRPRLAARGSRHRPDPAPGRPRPRRLPQRSASGP